MGFINLNSLGRFVGNAKNAAEKAVSDAAKLPGEAVRAAEAAEHLAEQKAKEAAGWVGDTFTKTTRTIAQDVAIGANAVATGAGIVVKVGAEAALVTAGLGILAVEGAAKGVQMGVNAVGNEVVREVKQTEAELKAAGQFVVKGLETVGAVEVAVAQAGINVTKATVATFVAGAAAGVKFAGQLEDMAENEALKTIKGAENWTQEQVDAFKAGYNSTQKPKAMPSGDRER